MARLGPITKFAQKLGFHGLAVSATTTAGLLAAHVSTTAGAAPSNVESLVLAAAAGGFAWLGSLWTNRAASQSERRDAEKIPSGKVLLLNHALTSAVALSIQSTLDAALQDEELTSYTESKKILTALRDQSAPFYEGLVNSIEEGTSKESRAPTVANLAQPSVLAGTFELPEVSTKASSVAAENPGVTDAAALLPSQDEWKTFLGDLFNAAVPEWSIDHDELDQPFETLQAPLSLYVSRIFPETFRELMKNAAAYPGSDIAKAHAAIELHVWAQLLSFVRQSRGSASKDQQIAEQIDNCLRRMDDKTIERHGQLVRAIEVLVPDVRQVRLDVTFLADSAKRGLISLEEFSQGYWKRQSSEPGLKRLFEDESRCQLLRTHFPGREKEIAAFREFLASDKEVLYFCADPGVGKSRLTIELAELARREGWRPEFLVSLAIKDLIDASANLKDPGARYLLVWDDFRPGDNKNLQQFLKLHELLGTGERPRIKRLITSWPVFRSEIERDGKPHWLVSQDLPPVEFESEAWIAFMGKLMGTGEYSGRRQGLASGNPLISMLAANLVISGKDPGELSGYDLICEASYRPITKKIDSPDLEAFRVVCACSRVEVKRAGKWAAALERLWKNHIVEKREGAYTVSSDILRGFVCRHSFLDDANSLALPDPADDWARMASSLFPAVFPDVWSITAWALTGEARSAELAKRSLLATARNLAARHASTEWAIALFNANAGEPSLGVRREIAGEIGKIADRHHPPLAAIDEEWAKALFNATVGEPSPGVRREIAGEIGEIADRHHPPLAAIDEPWAKALVNATVGEPSPGVRREIAGEIGKIGDRHHPPLAAIDEPWAKALVNATVGEPSPGVRREIAGEIGKIGDRHHPPLAAIDEEWAKALFNANAGEPSLGVCREIAGEIGKIAERHHPPVAAIDEEWAIALFNANAGEPSLGVRREIAGEIGKIADRHHPPVAAIDELWAKALVNATVGEPSPGVRREIAGEIGEIADRHHPPVAAIDEAWAKALFNATVGEPSPGVCREIAGEIGKIADRHHPALAAIDEEWAKALVNATVGEPSPGVRREIAGEIGKIADRHHPPLAAIDEEWANALVNATVGELSPGMCREIAAEIGKIADRHHPPVAAIDELWAKALVNATVGEPSPGVRREIAGEIGKIADRHHPPVAAIDEEWAKALVNATVGEPSPGVRREIAGEIGKIADRHHPPVAAIDVLWGTVLCMMLLVDQDEAPSELPWHDSAFRNRMKPRILEILLANPTVLGVSETIKRLQIIVQKFENET